MRKKDSYYIKRNSFFINIGYNKKMDRNIDIDVIIELIIEHEGLVPNQTPFRIVNDIMANWDHIFGYEIDKSIIKPKGRENFIFLKNLGDVFLSVRHQFYNYSINPGRYGLKEDCNIVEAIRLFDQSGANGKIVFLKSRISDFDENIELRKLFNDKES